MTDRIYNFAAGPAVLPEPVLQEAQRDLMALRGVGMSVMEISHRSKTFDAIIQGCEADIRKLAGISADYQVLFLQGGASLQFAMVPMNLLPAGGRADYILTGSWGKKAYKEAQKFGTAQVAGSTEADNFTRAPEASELKLDPSAAYVHFTSNETIQGVEWRSEPAAGPVPLVCDASSDIFSRPIDLSRYALIYAGAQKNLGPSGVTLVILKSDLLERVPKNLATMLDYRVQAENKSLYNTPSTFGIYLMGLTMKWLVAQGGLEAIGKKNAEKAKLLYDAIDTSGGYYRPHAKPAHRSMMNVTFRLPSEDLEKKFVSEATAAKLDGLKGHRSVGGIRASIYNAFPKAGVETLVSFMGEFRKRNG
jgi:phosphoserine aminotransferase